MAQISDSIAKLHVAQTHELGSLGATKVQPTVVDGVIYFKYLAVATARPPRRTGSRSRPAPCAPEAH